MSDADAQHAAALAEQRTALTASVKRLAAELGFARSGVARAGTLGHEAERLREWLAAGHHGDMDYMQRTAEVRLDPRHPKMLARAHSVIVLATPLPPRSAGRGEEPPSRIARYAHGRDYHPLLHDRLRKIARFLRARGHVARQSVDSMPVLERAWAQRAGVGFIGKNCCVIVPGLGSHVFLSAIVTSAELDVDEPMRERCGECRLCLDACPTRAFVASRWLDARRCIAYLTIEQRGAIEPELRPQIGDWLFGCDACQDVCPFNRGGAGEATAALSAAPAPWLAVEPEAWLTMDEARFTEVTIGSPLRRPSRYGMARNAAIVLGNARARRALPVLREAASNDESEVVREAARWAIDRIETER
jgi:epoxyqueuosine reductase